MVSTKAEVFSVTVLFDELAPKNNVAIITAVTTIIDDEGTVFIAVFGQEIDFTKNGQGPNQSQSMHIIWCSMPQQPY